MNIDKVQRLSDLAASLAETLMTAAICADEMGSMCRNEPHIHTCGQATRPVRLCGWPGSDVHCRILEGPFDNACALS